MNIDRIKQWLTAACIAFMRGLRGESPPSVGGVPAGRGPVLARDAVLAFAELMLSAAAIFAFVRVPGILVKAMLLLPIIVSVLRTYTAGKKVREEFFLWLERKK